MKKTSHFIAKYLLIIILCFAALTTVYAQQPVIVMNPVKLMPHTTVYVIFDGTQPVAITNFKELIDSQFGLSRSTDIAQLISQLLAYFTALESDNLKLSQSTDMAKIREDFIALISSAMQTLNDNITINASSNTALMYQELLKKFYNPNSTMTIVNPLLVYVDTVTVVNLSEITNALYGVVRSTTGELIQGYLTNIDNKIVFVNTKDVSITSGSVTVNNELIVYVNTVTVANSFIPINPGNTVQFINTEIRVNNGQIPFNSLSSVTVSNLNEVNESLYGVMRSTTGEIIQGHLNDINNKTILANTKDVVITSGSISVTCAAETPFNKASTVTVVNMPSELPINQESSVTVKNITECNTKDIIVTSGNINVDLNSNRVIIDSVAVYSVYTSSGDGGKITGVTSFSISITGWLFDISFLMKNAADANEYVTIQANWRKALPPIADAETTGKIVCVNPVYGAIFSGTCPETSTITWNATTGEK